jgi:hypothetical protein
MTNPTPQPASEPEEWRAEQRADGWWTLLTNSTILAFGLDTATKDTILAEHVQAARTRELEAVVATAREAYAWLAVTDTPHTTDGLRMLTAKLAAALQALEGTTNNV